MTWKCDVCSTANENTDKVCFVCGTARSEGSVLKEKLELREKRSKKKQTIIVNTLYMAGRIAFIGGVIGAMITIAVALILLIANESFQQLINNFSFVLQRWWENICQAAKNLSYLINAVG